MIHRKTRKSLLNQKHTPIIHYIYIYTILPGKTTPSTMSPHSQPPSHAVPSGGTPIRRLVLHALALPGATFSERLLQALQRRNAMPNGRLECETGRLPAHKGTCGGAVDFLNYWILKVGIWCWLALFVSSLVDQMLNHPSIPKQLSGDDRFYVLTINLRQDS